MFYLPVSSSNTHAAEADDDVCVGVFYFAGSVAEPVAAGQTTPDKRWMELRVAGTSLLRYCCRSRILVPGVFSSVFSAESGIGQRMVGMRITRMCLEK